VSEVADQVFSFCRHGRTAEVAAAVLGGFDADARDEHGNTLLLVAAQNGLRKMAKKLMRMGADVNCQNSRGQTVAHYCHAFGHTTLLEYILSKGADTTLRNADGMTYDEGIRR
jgi:ankyrin repeat protein